MTLLELVITLTASAILIALATVLILSQSQQRFAVADALNEVSLQQRLTAVLDDFFQPQSVIAPGTNPCAASTLGSSYSHFESELARVPEPIEPVTNLSDEALVYWHTIHLLGKPRYEHEMQQLTSLYLKFPEQVRHVGAASLVIATLEVAGEPQYHLFSPSRIDQSRHRVTVSFGHASKPIPKKLLDSASWALCYPVQLMLKSRLPDPSTDGTWAQSLWQKQGWRGVWEEVVRGVDVMACQLQSELPVISCRARYELRRKATRKRDWWYAL